MNYKTIYLDCLSLIIGGKIINYFTILGCSNLVFIVLLLKFHFQWSYIKVWDTYQNNPVVQISGEVVALAVPPAMNTEKQAAFRKDTSGFILFKNFISQFQITRLHSTRLLKVGLPNLKTYLHHLFIWKEQKNTFRNCL